MNRKTELMARAYFVVMMFTILALVIAYRVFTISILEGDKWRQKGAVNVKWMEVDADRGNIYADDMTLLVSSLQFFEIRLDATVPSRKLFESKVDSLALMLSKTVRSDKSYDQWRKDLRQARKKNNRYVYIAKGLSVDEMNMVRNFPIFRNGRYSGGYQEIRYGMRTKHYREMASRTLGEDRENAQKVGLEGYYDRFLKGPTDRRLMKRVEDGIWIPVYDPSEAEMQKGDDIVTTLNVHLQDVVHSELEEALVKYEATRGVAVMMETKTGAIKAISNLTLSEEGQAIETINTAIASSTEPGSTFKLATVLALLDTGHADTDTKVNLNGGIRTFYDKKMKDSEDHGKYEVTMKEAFAMSSNVGIAELANESFNSSTATRLEYVNKLRQFGLNDITGIEVAGEGTPKIKDPVKDNKIWYGTTIPWMAHGYEIALTPLQLLNFYNTVANDGKMMKPYLVSEIKNADGKSILIEPKVLNEAIAKPESIAKAKEMLEEVVLTGTAHNIKSEMFKLAGKTGTTRVNYTNKEEYAKYNASFCGYFPADNPVYTVLVILYEPKGAFYGSAVAAPVFKAIAEKTMAWNHQMIADQAYADGLSNIPESNSGFGKDFKMLFDYVGIPYKQKTKNAWVFVDPFETKMLIEPKTFAKRTVPDVRGMGARDAMYLLENLGLKVTLSGSGRVNFQSISPGTAAKGQYIEIELN